ncbi:hypothetical protein B0T10DRAFT_587770 [Thelonectria olida]|uniref:Uncharacterized protein n=1 Tax=Thelonectria olida TaxID=1576542 RepID=A0A9P8VVA1_9HYPO|nr:hypothetical protein B0T10DRAFT_587770 [Thelonectria olida]
MVKAISLWRQGELYKAGYKEVGLLRAGRGEPAAYCEMGFAYGSEFPYVQDARYYWTGALPAADFNGEDPPAYCQPTMRRPISATTPLNPLGCAERGMDGIRKLTTKSLGSPRTRRSQFPCL